MATLGIERHLANKIVAIAKTMPALLVTGPRQSGKTTLVRRTFPKHRYVSLENPDELDFALNDPRGFLKKYDAPAILDEVQRAPQILSYLQQMIDEDGRGGQWILTGSQHFLLMSQASQTLAGRLAIMELLPLSLAEVVGAPVLDPEDALLRDSVARRPAASLNEIIFRGFYPRLQDVALDANDWLSAYVQTYVERDVRNLLKIGDLGAFRRFLRLCAGRSGQILNFSSLANDAGISSPTAHSWIGILEASFIVRLLPPYFRNFNKRLIKAPKLYFLDTGLLCHLLEVRKSQDIAAHPLRGAIFETFVVSGLYKMFANFGRRAPLYFWRDHVGHEIDVVVDLGDGFVPLEIKSAKTVNTEFFKDMQWWLALRDQPDRSGILCYGGDQSYQKGSFTIHPWWCF
ncbi:MAG: ATP-binding protein [Elusimicrobiota bacterium]